MPDLFPESQTDLRAQIKEVEREMKQRAKVYPRLIESGRLSPAVAERQTDAMRAVLETLQGLENTSEHSDVPPQRLIGNA